MKIEKQSLVNASPTELYEWHARGLAFERLLPPWEKAKVIEMGEGLDVGRRTVLDVSMPWGYKRWIGEHTDHEYGRFFEDTQLEGPFKKWVHRHSFLGDDSDCCRMVDSINCELPFGILGELAGSRFVKKTVSRGLAYRHQLVRDDLVLYRKYKNKPRLRILIAGGRGFIGRKLHCLLETQGHTVFILTRSPKAETDIAWSPAEEKVGFERDAHFDVVINLIGENLASRKWTEKSKKAFWSSRVDSTRFLVNSIKRLDTPPKVFISGSAVGFYGDRGDDRIAEHTSSGKGFLAELCAAWEEEAFCANEFAERVCILRTGIVLDPGGGALQKMLTPFRLGLGGPLGSGTQWMPWISMEDWLYATYEIMMQDAAAGPFNLVSSGGLRNEQFSKVLAKTVCRPCFGRVPAGVLRLLMGEMADEALLSSQRVVPNRLENDLQFSFRYLKLENALGFFL